MNNMKDISIIVPIYNAEKYIDKCLTSLINQTKKELEIILINDGSTDKTEEIVKKYSDKRIKYFKNNNQGIGKTRNFGIEKATAKYIMFIDSDDYLEENACELLYEKAEKEKLEIVVCDFYQVYDHREKQVVKIPSFETTCLKNKPNLLLDINLSPWNKLYKRNLIINHNIRFVENLKYEDAPFVIEALDKAKRIGKIDKCLNNYVVHEYSETTVRDERIFDIIIIVDKIRKYLKGKKIDSYVDELTLQILMNYNIQQRMQKDKKIGMRFIDESFDYIKTCIPNYRKNHYYKTRSPLKRLIEKNKILTKMYCWCYRVIK